jgi:hypothetical protein
LCLLLLLLQPAYVLLLAALWSSIFLVSAGNAFAARRVALHSMLSSRAWATNRVCFYLHTMPAVAYMA